jgi:Ca-activated chloride channel family protein
VLIVLDVSGSMGDPADPNDPNGPTKLDLAKTAVQQGLDQFKDDDQVGLRIFTSDLGGANPTYQDLAPIGPIGANREKLRSQVGQLTPLNATPLYDVIGTSHKQMLDQYDPALINAVVILTDGKNDDGNTSDDAQQLKTLLADVTRASDGESAKPVRIFTIAYGSDADPETLKRISQASNATAYQAADATTINSVFTAVVSNF